VSGPETIPVEVAYARPDVQRILSIEVPRGTTVQEALERSGIAELFPEIDLERAPVGIFGTVVRDREQVLRAGDRVEIYRPLIADPKAQRAERARAQREAGRVR
jgi:hypothetical protein